MKYMKLLVLSLLIAVGLQSSSKAQPVTVLTGTTTEQASQLVLWYDQAFGPEGGNLGRFTYLQVTNAADHAVRIHVQFFRSFNPDPFNPATAVRCEERDFNDNLTPNDTVVYDLFSDETDNFLVRNTGDPVDFSVQDTKGFVVVTAVNADGEAISHEHLLGNSYVFDINNVTLHRLNAMGRHAVSFPSGAPLPDDTVLDGVSAGLVLIQPDLLKFNFEQTFTKSPSFPNLADIISISFIDNYDGAVFDGYAAEPGFVTWDNPLVFDLAENPESCDTLNQDCFFDIGFNEVIGVANPLLDDGLLYCDDNFTTDGWARVEVIGYDEFENELGIVAISTSNDTGDAHWMHVEGPAVPTPTPTPPECTSDTDCEFLEECDLETGTCVPIECTSDEDCPLGGICEDFVEPDVGTCIPGCTEDHGCPIGEICVDIDPETGIGMCEEFVEPTPTPTATPVPPTATPTSIPSFQPRQGSSGSCTSVAGAAPVGLGSALMSMLIPLLPAVGIGVRRFTRRNKGKKSRQSI